MPSYVVTGATRGLGFEFVRQLSLNPDNTVIGLARNKAAADENLQEAGVKGVTILKADIGDVPALKHAAEATAKLTGGGLDYLINNAAVISETSAYRSLRDFEDSLDEMLDDFMESFTVNAIGVVKTIHAFIPLLRKGHVKKIITISSGMADLELINKSEIPYATPYAVSKAAANTIVAKYNTAYRDEGMLFMTISPGYVNTERQGATPSGKDAEGARIMGAKFMAYTPHFKGAITPEESVKAVLGVTEKSSLENGDGGAFISHLGTKDWL